MAKIEITEGDDLARLRLWKMAPPFDTAINSFRIAAHDESTLSTRVREVARIRIAVINQCPI